MNWILCVLSIVLFASCATQPMPQPGNSNREGESEFQSFDNDSFGYREWLPSKTVKRVIIGSHGISGICNDYKYLAAYFLENDNNTAVYTYNLRSQGADPIKQRIGDIRDPKHWYKDLTAFTRYVRTKHPQAEIIWHGESMGSVITLNTFAHYHGKEKLCDKIMLSAPVIHVRNKIRWWQYKALQVGSQLIPQLRIPLSMLSGGAQLEITKDVNHTDNVAQVENYYVKSFTLRFLNIFGNEIEKTHHSIEKVEIPLAIFHGGKDFFSEKKSIEAFLQKAPRHAEKNFFHYPKAYHLMLYDQEKEVIFTDMLKWLKSNSTSAK